MTTQDDGQVSWYRNDGMQGFAELTIDASAGAAKRAEAADIDGDGDLDVVAASFGVDEIAWYDNDGSAGFTKRVIDSGANGAYYAEAADIDGDGRTDVVAASQLDDTVAWYRNLGGGAFERRVIDAAADGARSVRIVDIDGDGDLDVLAASVEDDTVALHVNDGTGTFRSKVVDTLTAGAYGVAGADMDGDGDIDVVSASRDANEVTVHHQFASHVASIDVGQTLVIDQSLLHTVDADDGPAELAYSLTEAPVAGSLRLAGAELATGSRFTQADVDSGSLVYDHAGGGSGPDAFSFTVADGGEDGVEPAEGRFELRFLDPDDLRLHLPFDEGAGAVAFDASGQGNDATLTGGAAFDPTTPDGSASAVLFGGLDDRVEAPAVEVAGSGLSLAAWFRAESFPGPSADPRIISKASGTAAGDHVFMLSTVSSGGEIRLRARVRVAGATTTLIATMGDLRTGTWYHGALTYDGSALRLYLDGAVVASTPLAGPVDQDPTIPVAIGNQPPGAGDRGFHGLIDDARILQRALGEAEVAELAGR